jgi:prepilin-type processing-associated H-X9-DG protein
MLYCANNDGFFPPSSWDIYTTNLHRWHGERRSPGEPFDFEHSPLKPYLTEGRIKSCPSFHRYLNGFETGCGGYGYNGDYIGSGRDVVDDESNTPAHEEFLDDPSKTVLFADCAFLDGADGHVIEYSFVTQPVYEAWWGIDSTPSVHFRHNGRANVAWADGHVTSEEMGYTENRWWYPNFDFKSHNIGYIGPWHDNRLYDRKWQK